MGTAKDCSYVSPEEWSLPGQSQAVPHIGLGAPQGREPHIMGSYGYSQASQVALVVKNLPANAGDIRDADSVPGSGRSPGGGHGNPFQNSCLENPMDRGACQATVHGVTESDTTEGTQHACIHCYDHS